jgi:hypothetical protein
MVTTHGDIPLERLEQRTVREPVPCGEAVCVQYYLNGELVRQDVEIQVTTFAEMSGKTGE